MLPVTVPRLLASLGGRHAIRRAFLGEEGTPKSVSLLLTVQTFLTAADVKDYGSRVGWEPGRWCPLKCCFRRQAGRRPRQHRIMPGGESPPFLGQHHSLFALEMLEDTGGGRLGATVATWGRSRTIPCRCFAV